MPTGLPEKDWPSPFWAGKLDEWLQPPFLEWHDPKSDQVISFQATFAQPESGRKVNEGEWPGDSKCGKSELPLVFFYGGMDCAPGLDSLGIRGFAQSIPKACVVVSPARPKKSWWVLDKGGDWGYIKGDLQPHVVKSYISWMKFLCRRANSEGCVDGDFPRVFGFSAGAYALTEMLVRTTKPFMWSLGLGGLHGHGQPESEGISDDWMQQQAMQKFEKYLERLRSHPGVPGGLFCFHHPEDRVCPWKYARKILEVLDKRQEELGYKMHVEELTKLDKASRATTARQLRDGKVPQMHGYQDTALLNRDFLWEFMKAAESASNHRPRTKEALRLKDRRSRSRSRRRGESPIQARKRARSRSASQGQTSRDRSVEGRGRRKHKWRSPSVHQRARCDGQNSREPSREPVRLVARKK